ncbi:hypothetical protein KC19_8G055700 [Ceratodon purpureus]|uniref:Uncharacterized protein n=1 Tax=Ceratodon purpureus TaxID=3225 RepID=A0A8T0GYU1_CERPU|nr:hypothetical protein KC19_8G055700 [Ceratodon purpureus]
MPPPQLHSCAPTQTLTGDPHHATAEQRWSPNSDPSFNATLVRPCAGPVPTRNSQPMTRSRIITTAPRHLAAIATPSPTPSRHSHIPPHSNHSRLLMIPCSVVYNLQFTV